MDATGLSPLSEAIASVTINFLPQQDIRYFFFLHWDAADGDVRLNFIEARWAATGRGGHCVNTNITWYDN
jgi:hypothetical protein